MSASLVDHICDLVKVAKRIYSFDWFLHIARFQNGPVFPCWACFAARAMGCKGRGPPFPEIQPFNSIS